MHQKIIQTEFLRHSVCAVLLNCSIISTHAGWFVDKAVGLVIDSPTVSFRIWRLNIGFIDGNAGIHSLTGCILSDLSCFNVASINAVIMHIFIEKDFAEMLNKPPTGSKLGEGKMSKGNWRGIFGGKLSVGNVWKQMSRGTVHEKMSREIIWGKMSRGNVKRECLGELNRHGECLVVWRRLIYVGPG